jgi:hypothetical protein
LVTRTSSVLRELGGFQGLFVRVVSDMTDAELWSEWEAIEYAVNAGGFVGSDEADARRRQVAIEEETARREKVIEGSAL